ncbi:MAG TPA: hypothetical protein VM324_03400 [Egibacteraceae bacterium]|nr:hypothetical protein [Egibacteraceae bacterium]
MTGRARAVVVVLAGVAQLIVLAPFTVASGLLAPLWAVGAFHVLWLGAAVVFVRVARRRPAATPLVPLANAALLWVAVTMGDMWLGWTA